MQKGIFITIEGGEGVGKSTNIDAARSFLQENRIDFIQTREPGGTLLAEKVRALLLEDHGEDFDTTAELLLMFAARAQHLNTLIKPALDRGTWILCDRFTDATYAYQGGGRQLDTKLIAQLETLVQHDLRPDLTIILDLDPAAGIERARQRGELDRFEQEQLAFFQRVRASYLEIAEREPQRCAVIDASRSVEDVSASLQTILKERLKRFLP
ncbi:MAG: dTMP kinase [Proteobacteria bacterium]|nr:dTMP kinase [Pseudomonadota bacterium]MDA0927357.1 dTMP kinase [Pseudomonadota bacterium]